MPKKIIVLGSLFFFFSCSQDETINNDLQNAAQSLTAKMSPDKVIKFKGPQVALGNGKVRSWISVSKETQKPIEIGIEMTPGALTGLPAADAKSPAIILPLHLKATQLTPFDHIGLNWNPNGHEPEGVFNVPHFDFHFYMISVEEQMAIPAWSPETDTAFNNYPPTTTYIPSVPPITIATGGYMPLGYATPPGAGTAEAQMGKHWVPVPFDYLPFTKVMVYGTYNGKIVFVEPMVTLEYLHSLSDLPFTDNYSQPKLFEKAGNYPTKYNIYHDATTGNFCITLSHFEARVATPY